MDTPFRMLTCLAVIGAAAAPLAQAQWTVTMRAMQNPIPVGQCTGIEVTVADDRGFAPVRPDKKQASGWDFDLEFTSAAPDAFAWRDERHRFLCANAPTAPFAVVVARYPSERLKPTERVPGLVLQRAIQVTMQGAAGAPVALAYAAMPATGAVPSAQPGGQGSAAVAMPQPVGATAPVDPATGYPVGAAPPAAPGYQSNGYPAPATSTGAPGYQANGYPVPTASAGGYPPPPAPAPGYPAPAYPAPGADPSQGYGASAAPAYPNGAGPAYPQQQQGYPSGPQPAPNGYPYPSDPASQVAQPGLPAQPVATQPAAQPAATQPAAQPQARTFKQLFKKIGDHAKQQARDVAGNTVNYTADAANSVLDNTLTSGSDLVKTKVQSSAGGLGGVGQALFSGVKGQDDPKDLAVALSAGRVVLHQLRFQEHTPTLDPSSGPLLAKLTQAILATPGQYLIEVHVDKTEGPRAQALSDQRAAAVKNALVSSGVPPTQLAAAGYGASRPPSTGSSERIEIMRTQ